VAHLRCDLFSDALGLSTSITVVLPQETTSQIGLRGATRAGEPPVLYLLHGLSDDDTIWARRTSIERYVAPLGLAVVMPQVHRSFYADEARGLRYWTYLSEELPALVGRFFRVSQRPEDTFVAGLSMGGYGAFKWALRQPDRFAAAASLSGALDIARRQQGWAPAEDLHVAHRVFGDRPLAGSDDDLLHLLNGVAPAGKVEPAIASSPARLPRLYLCCGTGDPLYEENVRFVAACEAHAVPLTSEFGPGEHDWAYWDAKIQDVLAWLPL
jgi:S-formylglutathione hydrolase FrmB